MENELFHKLEIALDLLWVHNVLTKSQYDKAWDRLIKMKEGDEV